MIITSSTLFSSLDNAEVRKKNLGQYFTNTKLANLLVTLAQCDFPRNVIDPMCGDGNMLTAVSSIYQSKTNPKLSGIEIDPYVHTICRQRLAIIPESQIQIIRGNAFNPDVISELSRRDYDLVITNPPYVRYQKLNQTNLQEIDLLFSQDIRSNLLKIVDRIEHLTGQDRYDFKKLILEYSGLSDLAVPSWLLCAMLVRVGGTLAIIVPTSWLSRDYAQTIHYLLLKFFRIRFVIEDISGVWFEDALIKTTLLIAERIPRVDNILEYWAKDKYYLHVGLSKETVNQLSIVGKLYPEQTNPDLYFTNQLVKIEQEGGKFDSTHVWIEHCAFHYKVEKLFHEAGKESWLRQLEDAYFKSTNSTSKTTQSSSVAIPQILEKLLSRKHQNGFLNLGSLGVEVGQGLRTGANRFFYADLVMEKDEFSILKPDPVFGIQSIKVPNSAIHKVLRNQSELDDSFSLDSIELSSRVMLLNKFLLPEIIQETSKQDFNFGSEFILMNESLANFVRTVRHTNIGTDDNPRFVPNLSAVKTNESNNKKKYPRFWYMLPSLALRHLPDLFVPRINHLHPKTFINSQEKVVIDANFSTLWLTPKAVCNVYGILAILNSGWVIASMELAGTVMGGSALKLEATQLKRIPIPVMSEDLWNELSYLGQNLAYGRQKEETLEKIDHLVCTALVGKQRICELRTELETLASDLLSKRVKRKQ